MGSVGVIGVGAMGSGMARALLARGFAVRVRDIVPDREQALVADGAERRGSAAALADDSEVVLTVVVDADQTREVLFGRDGVCESRARPVVVMCSTIAPQDTQACAERLAARGFEMLDAPVSGGPARAAEGALSVMAAGPDSAFERGARVLEAIAARRFRVGARAGDGSRMKIVNNMLAAANLAAGCEAMALAGRLGLDLRQVRDVVNASSGASWIFADRMGRALEGDYAPRAAARVLRKDVTLFVEAAKALGLEAPMAQCAQDLFADTVERGFGEEDDAAVLKRYLAAWGPAPTRN